MAVARIILNNTLYNMAGRIWVVIVNLFLSPLILGYLGRTFCHMGAVLGIFKLFYVD